MASMFTPTIILMYFVFSFHGILMQTQPKSAADFVKHARAMINDERYDKAIVDFSEAIRLDPQNADTYVNRGDVYLKESFCRGESREPQKAIADFTEALRINPHHPTALRRRAIAHYANGDCEKAISDCSAAVRDHPDDPIAFAHLDFLQNRKRDIDQIIAEHSAVI